MWLYGNPLYNLTHASDIVDRTLAAAMNAMQVTVASTLGIMQWAITLSHDVFLNVLLIEYLQNYSAAL